MPEAINYTEARKSLAATMDKVCRDHEPVIITRQKSEPVVMMSLAEYNAIQETAYLLKSPKNAERLRESIKQAETGLAEPRGLSD
jgi:antitoxin YefM